MPCAEGYLQGYNAQAAVDRFAPDCREPSHATNQRQATDRTDSGLKQVRDALGKPEGLLADAGYFSEDNVNLCEGVS